MFNGNVPGRYQIHGGIVFFPGVHVEKDFSQEIKGGIGFPGVQVAFCNL